MEPGKWKGHVKDYCPDKCDHWQEGGGVLVLTAPFQALKNRQCLKPPGMFGGQPASPIRESTQSCKACGSNSALMLNTESRF